VRDKGENEKEVEKNSEREREREGEKGTILFRKRCGKNKFSSNLYLENKV
jgi:hypothetical protein